MAVVALVCAAYLSFAQYGFDLLEEGYFATNARRVQLGGLPYRDFDTPYSPAVFYLYAWVMDLVGPNVVALRALQIVGRGVFCLALYAAGRQLMSPFFAALAPALILAIDTPPGVWSIHPGWFTAPCSTVAVLAVARYLTTGRGRWLAVAGVTLGAAFAFKQNLAVYGTMATLWLLAVAEPRLAPVRLPRAGLRLAQALPSRAVRALGGVRQLIGLAALVALPLVVTVLVWPYRSGVVLLAFVAPLAALSLAARAWLGRTAPQWEPLPAGSYAAMAREAGFYVRFLLVLAPLGTITLAWLLPLIGALDGDLALLGPLAGRLDLTGYYLGMEPPGVQHLALTAGALALPAILVLAARAGLWGPRGLALVAGALAGAVTTAAYRSLALDDPWNVVDSIWSAALGSVTAWRTAEGHFYVPYAFVLYLPTVAFWAGLALWCGLRVEVTRFAPPRWVRAQSHPAADARGLVRLWYLAAGSALLLNQYPRMDEVHLLWSGGVLFVAGADVLHRWYVAATRATPGLARAGGWRLALRLSLVALPLLAALPIGRARWTGAGPYFRPAATTAELARPEGPYGLVRLDVPGDRSGLWLAGREAQRVQEVVRLLQEKTAPGEPIFAYPAIPGIYYLADRPNATRFNHLFPGMASPADQEDMVRQLESVRYVIWDDGGAHYWVKPGVNAPVTEYIRSHFRIERFIGELTVLVRAAEADGWALELPYSLPPTS